MVLYGRWESNTKEKLKIISIKFKIIEFLIKY